jgi:hypothetical protein
MKDRAAGGVEILFDEEWDARGSDLPMDVRWIDIETRKVRESGGRPDDVDGEWWRWQPFMISVAGVMDPGVAFVTVAAAEDEAALIAWAGEILGGYEVRYSATRQFDEMVLRGRFWNARRAFFPAAGRWPNLDDAAIAWANRRAVEAPRPPRSIDDVESRLVPRLWARGESDAVTIHCARDAAENLLRDPDAELSPALRDSLEGLLG